VIDRLRTMSRKHKPKQSEQANSQAQPDAEQAAGDAAGEIPPAGQTDQVLQELHDEVERLAQEVSEANDKYLRPAAELENTRRRAQNDVQEARKFAVKDFAEAVVNVRDSLELAEAWEPNGSENDPVGSMKEGLQNTLKQLDQVLDKFSIKVVAPAPGDKLDPNLHQAMTTQESTEIAPNHVVSVIRKGYTLHDRLLRPAMVIVARAASQSETPHEKASDA